jgi:AcrR family transcriptional regulator
MSTKSPGKRAYHHGDLAATLVEAAVSLLKEKGPASLSLREVARVAGVSHGAPAHHFGDKIGLLTAVATEGHRQLAVALKLSQTRKRSARSRLLAAGEAYVLFAVTQPAFFSIMFQSDLIDNQDAQYLQASASSIQILHQDVRDLEGGTASTKRKISSTVIALWSQVHGFATLWLAGNFGDPEDMDQLRTLLSSILKGVEPKLD